MSYYEFKAFVRKINMKIKFFRPLFVLGMGSMFLINLLM